MRRFRIHQVLWVCQFILVSALFAAGPNQVANMKRSDWATDFKSSSDFDQASRLAILSYAKTLLDSDTASMAALKMSFGIKSFDSVSFAHWKQATLKRLFLNYQQASKNAESGQAVLAQALDENGFYHAAKDFEKTLPEKWKPTWSALQSFSGLYFREQGRLAALFPKVTSEISVFDSTEIQGYGFEDKQFLLTFDDGPTVKGGTSDSLMAALRKLKLSGIFFVLGDHLNPRLQATGPEQVRGFYQGMNVQVHGMTHVSHAKLPEWKSQVMSLHSQIDSVLNLPANRPFFFRPPYGQRVENAAKELAASHGTIMLWNIDSQDWNAKVSGMDAAQRCFVLMLLWRKGILLFHDIHPKAQVAVPLLQEWLKNTGIIWLDANRVDFPK